MTKRLFSQAIHILLGLAMTLPSYGVRVYAQAANDNSAPIPHRAIPVDIEPGTDRLSNPDFSRMVEVTDPKTNESFLLDIERASEAELKKFSPEELINHLEQLQKEFEFRRQNFSRDVKNDLKQIKGQLSPIVQSNENAKRLSHSIDQLLEADFDRFSLGEIKSRIRDLKSRVATTHPLPSSQQVSVIQSLYNLQKKIVHTEYMNNQQFRAANQSKSVFMQTAVRFPMESLFFNIAMGLVMSVKMAAAYQENPMAFQQMLESLTMAETHVGFFSFMLANAAVTPHLHTLIKNPRFGFFIPYMGMATGMMASNITHDLYSLIMHKGLVTCALGYLGAVDENERRLACASSYQDLAINGKIIQYGAGLTSLIGATAASGLIQKGTVKAGHSTASLISHTGKKIPANNIIRLTGARVMAKITPAGWFLEAGHITAKIGQFTGFLGTDTVIHPLVRKPWGNYIHGGNLKKIEEELDQYLIQEWPTIQNKITSEDLKEHCERHWLFGSHFQRRDPRCNNVATELNNFVEATKEWHEFALEKANMAHSSWLDKVTHAMNLYGSAQSFYTNIADYINEYKDSGSDATFISPLDRIMPLNGIRPYYMPAEFSSLYLEDMDYVMVQRLISLQQSLSYLDGLTDASPYASKKNEFLPIIQELQEDIAQYWAPIELEEHTLQRSQAWARALNKFSQSLNSNSELRGMLTKLTDMGFFHRTKTQVPFRLSYSLPYYLAGIARGLQQPLQNEIDYFKNYRKSLSIQGNPATGDSIAASIIISHALYLNPMLAEELPEHELSLATSQTADDYTRILRDNPLSLLSSYSQNIKKFLQPINPPTKRIHTEIQIIKSVIGKPEPMLVKGQGFLAAYEKAKASEILGEIPAGATTPLEGTLLDFFVQSMVCGPDAMSGEDNFAHNRYGFSDRFYPPSVVDRTHVNKVEALCNPLPKQSMQAFYQQPLDGLKDPAGNELRGPIDYLIYHSKKEAISQSAFMSDWWEKHLTPQLEEAMRSYSADYDKIVAQLLNDFLNADSKAVLKGGNLSNNLFEALRQQRRLYLGILGDLVTASFLQKKKDIPQELLATPTEVQSYKLASPNESLFVALRGGEAPSLYPLVNSTTQPRSQNFYKFQVELIQSFQDLEDMFTQVQFGFNNRSSALGWIIDQIKLKNVSHMKRDFTRAEAEERMEHLNMLLDDLVPFLTVELELTPYQEAIANAAIRGLKEVERQFVTMTNITTALEFSEAN